MLRDTLRTPFRTVAVGAATAIVITVGAPAAGAQVVDDLGRPSAPVLGSAEQLAAEPWVPETVRAGLLKAIGFFRGSGEPGVALPTDGGPFSQFAWPTVMPNCIGGTQQSVGTAMAVPGPSPLPVPGVPAGHVAFVFTALGTGKVAATQQQPIAVNWVNINNGRTGTTMLGYTGINPEGPATVNGLADTGSGTVLMMLQGGVTTDIDEGRTANCVALPTVGSVTVP